MPTETQSKNVDAAMNDVTKAIRARYKKLNAGVNINTDMEKNMDMNSTDMQSLLDAQKGYDLSSRTRRRGYWDKKRNSSTTTINNNQINKCIK